MRMMQRFEASSKRDARLVRPGSAPRCSAPPAPRVDRNVDVASASGQLVTEVTGYLERAAQGPRVVPGNGGSPIGLILLPIGRSAAAGYALRAVIDLFSALPVRVHVLHVIKKRFTRAGPVDDETHEAATACLEAATARLKCSGISATGVVRTGDHDSLANLMLAEAQRSGAGLIVLGARPRGVLTSMIAGSTSREVLRETSCPVLMVRTPDEAAHRSADRS